MDALDEVTRSRFDRRVRPLISRQLIDEHRQRPFGPHSAELQTVLRYLRRPDDARLPRYVLHRESKARVWSVREVRRTATMVHLGYVDGGFTSQEEAEHAVFRLRLADRDLWPKDDAVDR